MAWYKELWLLARWHKMLDRAEQQYVSAAWEVRDDSSRAGAYMEAAKRFEARARYFQVEYERLRDARASKRVVVSS